MDKEYVETLAKDVVLWTQWWMDKNGDDNTKVVIGISGGKDSTVTAKILVEALGKDRVIGVMMPNGEQKDIQDSIKVCELLGIKNYTINIGKAYEALTDELKVVAENGKPYPTPMYATNTPARLRMATLYGIGATIGNCRVVNTCNLSEDYVWGNYSTLYGDSAGDFAPLQGLTVTEVIAIGDYFGLPASLVHKAPSDGMCGTTDERNLAKLYGIENWTYAEFDKFIRGQECIFNSEQKDKLFEGAKKGKFKRDLIRIPKFDPKLPNAFEC